MVTLTYEISKGADSALFYIEFVKRKLMDIAEAKEIQLYSNYSIEVVNLKVYLEKVDVDVTISR